MNLNKVFLIGRLAADPETRNTPTGQNVSTIRLVTNRVWIDKAGQKQEQGEFHTVVAWGKLSDIIDKYVRRGQMIYIEGRIQTRSWSGNDGTKKYRTEIVAEGLQLGPKASGTGFAAPQGAPTQSTQSPSQKTWTPSNKPAPVISPKEEEIPVINQDEPIIPDTDHSFVEEAEIDLKDIPF